MTEVFARFLSISLSGALVAAVILALLGLLGKRLSKTWRYYVWLIVLLRLVIPFAPQGNNLIDLLVRQPTVMPVVQPQTANNAQGPYDIILPDGDAAVDVPVMAGMAAPPVEANEPSQPAPNETINQQAEKWSPRTILMELWQYAWIIWLGVAMMLLVRIITSYHSFTRFIRAGWQPVDDPAVLDTLDEVSSLYGIRRILPVYLNPLATSPMLVGVIRPVIVLPTCQMGQEALRHILAHELVHYKRKDILYKWVMQVVCCLHWFNPMVYLVKRDMNIACELSCDERVLTRLESHNHKRYGDTLLAVIQTSGKYGDTVASVTMSEEGKMMKKRLQSIASPHRRSKLTVMFSVALSILLLFGAAYAGAYTGAPTTEPTPESAESITPASEATRTPSPGEKLDTFLENMDEMKETWGEQAKEWGEVIADKADEWGQDLSNLWDNAAYWAENWDWSDNWNFSMSDDADNMFGSYRSGNRTVIHTGYYVDGYIFHMKYDSATEAANNAVTVLEEPSVLLPAKWKQYAEEEAFLNRLQGAVDAFIERNPAVPTNQLLSMVDAYGPYEGTADELLARFYQEDKLGHFVAVLESGQTSAEQRMSLMYQAAEDDDIAVFSILLDEDVPVEDVDALLQNAYDQGDVAQFYILMDYASPELRQSMKDRSIEDGRAEFLGAIDEAPSPEAIESMIDNMDDLNPGVIAMVTEYLTHDQALRIATAAYESDNVAVFSIVLDMLSSKDVEMFNARAREDQNVAIYSMTGW